MWALITDSVVVELTDVDPNGRYHPSMQWVECEEIVRSGWAYEGGVFIEPASTQHHVPSRVTMRQARLALHAAGLLTAVEAAIDAMPEPPQTTARIEWDYASEVHRASEFVGMLGTAIGLDEQGLDELFFAASAI